MDIFENPLEFIGIILTFATIIVSIVLYRRQRQRKTVSYSIISSVPLLSVGKEISEKLQILFNGEPVQQVHLVEIGIFNSGNTPIEATEFKRPVSLSFGEEAQIFTAEVTEATPKSLHPTVRNEGNRVVLEPTLLNQGDSIKLKMLVAKFAKVVVDGRIVGVKEIAEFVEKRIRYWLSALIGLIIQLIGLYMQSLFPRSFPINLIPLALIVGGGVIGLYSLSKVVFK